MRINTLILKILFNGVQKSENINRYKAVRPVMTVIDWIGFADRVPWIRRKPEIIAGRRDKRLTMICILVNFI